jgi:hypothetical protein
MDGMRFIGSARVRRMRERKYNVCAACRMRFRAIVSGGRRGILRDRKANKKASGMFIAEALLHYRLPGPAPGQTGMVMAGMVSCFPGKS